MGHLIDRPKWEKELPQHRHLLDGLERHTPLSDSYSLGEWLDDGHSGSRVARVIRSPETAQLILKFCASQQRAEQLGQALEPRNDFVNRHLAPLEREPFNLGVPYDLPKSSNREASMPRRRESDAFAAFMQVAGGDLRRYRSLFRLRMTNPARSDIDYSSIIRSLVGEWNDNNPPQPVARTVRSIVGGLVGHRRGGVIRWIRGAGDLGSRMPIEFLTGALGRRVVEDLLIGKAHGDLNARNILIPDPARQEGDFELIDYDHYEADALLARDPMHLLVGLALDDFTRLQPAGPDVIRAIVDPQGSGNGGDAGYFREISRAIHDGCRTSFPKGKALGDLWEPQCLLALVGVALRRVGRTIRTDRPEVARRWCYDLAAAAAERYLEQFGGSPSAEIPSEIESGGIIDRYFEREALNDRLTHGPHGVVSVRGRNGAGKSKLVDAVIDKLGPDVRSVRQHVAGDYRLDVPALIELIGAKPARVADQLGAALVRLEALLAELRDPVIIAVESAEQLLDANTRRLVDFGLEEAFTLLNADERHRVSVVLETPDGETLPGIGPDEDMVTVPGLVFDDFVRLLGGLDPVNRLRLKALSPAELHELWDCTDGLPRIGELIHAAVCHADLTLSSLLNGLRDHRHDPTVYLLRALTEEMHPRGRKLLRALAALGTPVPVRAIQRMLSDIEPAQIQQGLWNFHADRLVRAEAELFFLPAVDAKIILEQMPTTERQRLSYAAAKALADCAEPTPRTVADLRYHVAEIRALVDAGRSPRALRKMQELDVYLRPWNCTSILLPQRIAVRGRLGSPEYEKVNENALGGIYLATGALENARGAFEFALQLAGADADPQVLARLHVNVASVNWESNNIDGARASHEDALREATEAGDRISAMGARNGLADYHRRRGEYARAIEHATTAFEHFRSPGFTGLPEAEVEGRLLAVGLTVRLSRWYAEQDNLGEAQHWLEETRSLADHAGARHRATYLNALADLRLYEILRGTAVDTAAVIETAGRAMDHAFQVQDRLALLQARTTMCVAHLRAGRPADAATSIMRAAWHRPRGRHLVVLALEALTRRLSDDHHAAADLFDDLRKEADDRIAKDVGISVRSGKTVDVGRADFGARHFQGFARCGLVLAGRADMASAVASFRMPEIACLPHAPGLIKRMAFMLQHLDASAARPGILQPALDALQSPGPRSSPCREPA